MTVYQKWFTNVVTERDRAPNEEVGMGTRSSFEEWAADPIGHELQRLRRALDARKPWPPRSYGRRVGAIQARESIERIRALRAAGVA